MGEEDVGQEELTGGLCAGKMNEAGTNSAQQSFEISKLFSIFPGLIHNQN
jgi:hypothetical protein